MKPVEMKELEARMLNTPEARASYIDADRELEMQELLFSLREHASLNKAELARRLGVTPSVVGKLEKNPLGASMKTLEKYAAACGARLALNVVYK